jgi:hypothetical protein
MYSHNALVSTVVSLFIYIIVFLLILTSSFIELPKTTINLINLVTVAFIGNIIMGNYS